MVTPRLVVVLNGMSVRTPVVEIDPLGADTGPAADGAVV